KTRLLKSIARLFGPGTIYPLLHGMEVAAGGDYALQDKDVAALANEERNHARSLGAMSRREGGVSERWHRSAGGGTLRASIFGVSHGTSFNLTPRSGLRG